MIPLETDRLIVRNFRPEDWQDLQAYVSRPDIMWYERPWDASDEACRQQVLDFSKSDRFLAVEWKACGKMIGHLYYSQIMPLDFMTWMLGYIFNSEFQHRGFATEACRAVLDHGFRTLGVHRVEARCSPENVSSWRLMERLGMRREGHSPKCVTFRKTPEGKAIWWDELRYGILDEEWPL